MFNFLKKKELNLEFVTHIDYAHAYEYTPIKRSSRFIPNWFKNTPKSKTETNPVDYNQPEYSIHKTVRSCIGIQNLLTAGVTIPWWCDLQVSVHSEGYRYMFSDNKSEIRYHSNDQAPGFFDDYYFLKVKNPWMLRSSRRIKFMIMPYFYSDNQNDIITMPAIGETLSKQHISNLHFFLAIKKTVDFTTYNFKHNTPALQIIPLTEDEYTVSNKIIDTEQYNLINNLVSVNISSVNSGIAARKLSKCPFHNKD